MSFLLTPWPIFLVIYLILMISIILNVIFMWHIHKCILSSLLFIHVTEINQANALSCNALCQLSKPHPYRASMLISPTSHLFWKKNYFKLSLDEFDQGCNILFLLEPSIQKIVISHLRSSARREFSVAKPFQLQTANISTNSLYEASKVLTIFFNFFIKPKDVYFQ